MHGDVSIGKNAPHGAGNGFHQLLGTLESESPGHANDQVGEVVVAGAADADAVHFEHALDVKDGVGNLGANAGGSGVEKRVDGTPR